jgi:hypothetical protein
MLGRKPGELVRLEEVKVEALKHWEPAKAPQSLPAHPGVGGSVARVKVNPAEEDLDPLMPVIAIPIERLKQQNHRAPRKLKIRPARPSRRSLAKR